jgi:hypothetical protein
MAQCRFALHVPLAQYLHLKAPGFWFTGSIRLLFFAFLGESYVDVGK